MEALNMQQNEVIRAQQKDLLIRDFASQTDDMSHLEVKAKDTSRSYFYKIIKDKRKRGRRW